MSQADHEVTVFNKLLKELSYIKNSFISAIDLPFSMKDSTRLSWWRKDSANYQNDDFWKSLIFVFYCWYPLSPNQPRMYPELPFSSPIYASALWIMYQDCWNWMILENKKLTHSIEREYHIYPVHLGFGVDLSVVQLRASTGGALQPYTLLMSIDFIKNVPSFWKSKRALANLESKRDSQGKNTKKDRKEGTTA